MAKLCQVAPRTVVKWIDSGRLRGYRIPGSEDRRVSREELIRFLKEHGMPLGEMVPAVLLVGLDLALADRLGTELPPEEGVYLWRANGPCAAGVLITLHRPAVVVVDLSLGRPQSLEIAGVCGGGGRVAVLALACEDDPDPEALTQHDFSEAWKKPFDPALLARRLRALALGAPLKKENGHA